MKSKPAKPALKAEKREAARRKARAKKKRGPTLAGQVNRASSQKGYKRAKR